MTPLPPTPTVSVIIPARAAAATIDETLRSVTSQQPPPDEIVIAVPPDDEPTRAAIARGGESTVPVTVVDNVSGRTPDGLNAALERARGDVIARVDAHSVLPAGYLATAVAALADDSGVGNVGGLQRSVGTGRLGRAIAAAVQSPLGSGGAAHRSGTQARDVDTVYLGVFRGEALRQVGGFDPRLTRNQDYELNVRLRQAGWRVRFLPELAADHRARAGLRALARQYFQYGRWRRATMLLHPGSVRARQLALPVALLGWLVASVVGLAVGAWWVAPTLLVVWLSGLVAAGATTGESPLLVAAALATIHASWALGLLLGPPVGWRGQPS